MEISPEEFKEGIRNGTVVFCMPAAHDEFTSEFLDDFSARILKQDWRDLSMCTGSRVPTLLDGEEAEDEIVAAIQTNYGADVSDLPGLPLWDVLRRCARSLAQRG